MSDFNDTPNEQPQHEEQQQQHQTTDDSLKDSHLERLQDIAETGTVEIDWPDLQRALKSRLIEVVAHYLERKNNDCKDEQYDQEPNVEQFNLDNSRDEILELISSFTEPPFTIQRVCELLSSPLKYYDRISTFFRGLEKNLRVISSNDWPKSQSTNINSNSSVSSEGCIISNNNDSKVEETINTNDHETNELPQAQSSEPQSDQDIT